MSTDYNLQPGQLIKWQRTFRYHMGHFDSRHAYCDWERHDKVYQGIVLKEDRFSIWVYPDVKNALVALFKQPELIELDKSKIILIEPEN